MPSLWMVNQYAIPPELAGGTRHFDFAKELIAAGWNVKIFASNVHLASRQDIRDMGQLVWKEENCDGVPFVWIKTERYAGNNWKRLKNMLVFSSNLLKAGRKQAEKPDVIIGSSPNLFAANAALKLSQEFGIRFILEVRDLWPQSMIDLGYSRFHPMVLLLGIIEKKLYESARKIIVLAEGAEEYLKREKQVNEGKICFIPNGVRLDTFKASSPRETTRKKFGMRTFTCAYIGAHGPSNALETIVDAAGETEDDNIDWLLVGDGPQKEALLQEARKRQLGNIRFLDPIPKTEVPDFLQAIDAAVICLKNAKAFSYAISPNKLFDYMAGSCPILCAVPGRMAEMVEKTGCGFPITPENGAELARKAEELRNISLEKRLEMGKRGRMLVEKEYDRKKLKQRLLDVLSEVE